MPNLVNEEKPKKKGRPKSKHYVKESELREEIGKTQKKMEEAKQEVIEKWEKKIAEAATEAEKQKLQEEFEKELEIVSAKTFCTPRLGEIIILTVDRVGTQTKFRRYTYLEDMKAEAIFQSVKGIVKFSLDKRNAQGAPSSAFSYLTQIITNAFRQILKKEKRNREIKDQAIDMAVHEAGDDTDLEFESIGRKKDRIERAYKNDDEI